MARLPLKERAISAVVVVPAAIIVVALAFLQYHWSNQVSEATSLRLADSLQMSMINWHLDLFRDLSQICVALGVDPGGDAPADLQQFARSYAEWRAAAPYPELVSGFYLLQNEGTALRFDPSGRRFTAGAWPARLEKLRDKLRMASTDQERRASSEPTPPIERPWPLPGQQFVESFYPGGVLTGWRFDPMAPALVHPIFRAENSAAPARGHARSIVWVVLELSDDILRTRILPDLAQRYFQGTEGLDFQVAVVAGSKTGEVIYSSDSGFGRGEVRDADGTMDVFGRVRDKALGSPVHVFQKPSLNRGPTATVGVSWFPLLVDSPADLDWQLIVRHRRGGPMGAFVNELRRRDLMISFGVLFLLVVSMAMLMITSYRAQRLAKLQMNFVTTISHELRTPLTVISSAADNIAHGVVEGRQQLAQYGSVIGSHARQLSGLVEQILLFAANREGRQRYNSRLLGVPEIIETALASTADLIRTAEFTVEANIDKDLPPVMGDLAALSQCLQNLITNALKYGAEQRWMGIRASLREHAQLGREIQISVSDCGMGIASSDLPHIFELFYRSSSAAAAQIHGTGLGLPLAKSIAEAMDGKLTVTSVPGRGTTFILHLPCGESPLAAKVQPSPVVAQH
jgi:signal transduction histidine kinase